jgi:hypothetical protein
MTKPSPISTWHHQVTHSLMQHMWYKAVGTMLFIAIFFGVYLFLLKYPMYPTTVMPFIEMDELIGFQPMAMPLYLSLWLYVSLPPALAF